MTKISLDIDDADLARLQKEAEKNERSLASQIRFIVKEFFEK